MKHLLTLGVLAMGLGLPLAASASPLVDHSAGIKLLGGADIYSTPSDTGGNTGLGFLGNGGGFSYGVMGYYELRLIKLIGVEVGLGYNHGSFHRNVTQTYNGVSTDYTETVTMSDLRIPVLAKLVLPLAVGRFWVGLGPEFSVPLDASAKLEVKSGGTIDGAYTAKKESSIYGTGGLGLVLDVPVIGVEIPIEFRASKNFSQDSAWQDRVAVSSATSAEIKAQSSWDLRLGVGMGVSF